MIICLERGADLHMAQLIPLSLTVSCSSKIQIGFRPGKRAVKRVCVCVLHIGLLCMYAYLCYVVAKGGGYTNLR